MRLAQRVDINPEIKVAAGRYHAEMIAVEEGTTREKGEPFTKFSLQVRAGTTDGQVNRTHHEIIKHYPEQDFIETRNQNQICNFAIKTGVHMSNGKLATEENLNAAFLAQEEINFNWAEAVGKHLIIEIEHTSDKKDKDKKYVNIKPGCIFDVDDPRVAEVPKDVRALQKSQAKDVF